MSNPQSFEVIIVGGGIAGASLAWFLAERGVSDVLLLERESQPGYHTTGRSAASLIEWDRHPVLQLLRTEGAAFLRNPPPGFSEHPLLYPYGILVAFQGPEWDQQSARVPSLRANGTVVNALDRAEIVRRYPVLSEQHLDGGLWFPEDGHIDVHGLLWSYLRRASERGVQRRCDVTVQGFLTERGRCRGVVTNAGEFHANRVVNAAGAWAGELATTAGASPIRLSPYRRTIITFETPDGLDLHGWPMIVNESHRLYFAPESGGVLACPMEEDPMEPCDARPDPLRIAEAVDRVGRLAPRLAPHALKRTWAGLRTFAPDRVPVLGEDSRLAGFFWLAGQGGCGIETSAAVGRIAAELLVTGRTKSPIGAQLSPARFE